MTTLSTVPALIAATMAATCFGIALSPVDAAAPRTRTVRLADIDLGRADDRAVLEKRLKSAARALCATGNDPVARSIEDACIRETLAKIAARST